MPSASFDRTLLDALFVGYQLQFETGMQKATSDYKKLATIVQSSTAIERYPLIEQFAAMREWIGPRKIEQIKLQTLQVKNKTFESAVRVPRNAIADEQCGIYGALIAGLGMSAENLWDDLMYSAMLAPETWFDDAAFFGTTRTYGNAVIANAMTASLTNDNYQTARSTMMAYRGHGDAPLSVIPDTLVVGPALEGTARSILEGQFRTVTVSNNTAIADNPSRGTANLIISTRLVGTHANTWFLLATNDVIKPIILQQREVPALTRVDTPESEFVFKYNENVYGTFARGAAVLTAPHLILRSIPA